ncbi:acriflavin resistance protein D [Candidatus Protochlamydia naegleriophila]|uniref:Acriflavin resistance protein D n=1 Tax=Candidatus Protochlamydia naegleriophila TaxID=389348 RepID=A0A0U5JB21_9BACT|nr:efflux RND transporter permease subunit [Candidatus Protochlamydia naegleriophila]CUI17032.1 acriflavin resistance protein D [Candidatus Protochlamydia naegleriophila]
MILSDLSVKRPVFITMIMLALVVFGTIAFKELGVDLFPKVDFPVITIVSTLPGADPETIEKSVTEIIEEAVSNISSIKHLRSTSAEGISQIAIEFDLEKNVDIAYQEVQAKLGTVRQELPSDLKDIIIEKFDIDSAPIMAVVISGDQPIQNLSKIAEKTIKDRLQQVQGVGQIKIVGKQDRNIWIYLDPYKLEGLHLSVQDVIQSIRTQHIEFPGGRIETGSHELPVKIKAEFDEAQDLASIVVAYQNGYPIKIADVGRIVDGLEEQRTLARLDEQHAVALIVRRQSGTNTVTVAKEVKKAIEQLKGSLAAQGIKTEIAQDLSVFIEHSIEEIEFHLIFGGALAVVIVFLFLRNFRITLISALAIPISVIATFTLLKWMDFTLNTMTMLALSLSIGILIDDAIVVVENIYRHFRKSNNAEKAAMVGTQEIGLAAFAITMSIVAVFLPVAFMKGLIGRFFYQFGLTVTFAVLISLFVAFTLTPMLSAKFLKISNSNNFLSRWIGNCLHALDNSYESVLTGALRFRKTTLLVAFSLLFLTLYMGQYVRSEFVPLEDRSEFFVKVRTPLGSSLVITDDVLKNVRAKIQGQDWFRYSFTTIGNDSFNKVNEGGIYIKMTDKAARDISQTDAMKWVRDELAGMQNLKISVEPVQAISGGGVRNAAIQLDIKGHDLDKIESIAQSLMTKLEGQEGYVDLDTSYETGKPEIEVLIKRNQAFAMGVAPAVIAQAIKPLIGGTDISKFRADGERYNITVRLQEAFRNKSRDLLNLAVRNDRGNLVKLDHLIDIEEKQGPVQINRYNRFRIISLYSNLRTEQKVLGEAINEITSFIKEIDLPPGYSVQFSGNAESMKESFNNLLFALFLAVIVVYMVLASQFESFVQPFIIMLSVPFSIVGALGILVLTKSTLSIFTIIGIIMLMGLVTKNAILLIDYINTLRVRDGLEIKIAILQAAPTRLHPILMTTLAMVFGMLPIALSNGPGSESRAPMALAIIGGLITSMFLTLIIVPVIYFMMDNTLEWLTKLFTARKRTDIPTNVEPAAH